MAGLREIAAETGLSVRTVSRVLSESGSFSDKTRDLVHAAANKLGYRPNLYARCLKTRRSLEIVVVINALDDLHMSKIKALENTLRAKGYWVSILIAHTDTGSERLAVMNEALARRPAGLALISPTESTLAEAVSSGHPYIAIDSMHSGYDAVNINRAQGVCEAIHYLSNLGCKRIAYAPFNTPDDVLNHARLTGYVKALGELHLPPLVLPVTPDLHDDADNGQFRAGRALAHRWRELPVQPDGVQAFSDYFAMGMLAGFHETGHRVPQDVAVIGFDDRPAAMRASPPLTTVAQPHSEVGIRAAEILIEKIEGAQTPAGGWSCQLPPHLIVRETTATASQT